MDCTKNMMTKHDDATIQATVRWAESLNQSPATTPDADSHDHDVVTDAQVLHCLRVDKLSLRQAAKKLACSYSKVQRISARYPDKRLVARALLEANADTLVNTVLGATTDAKTALSALSRLEVLPSEAQQHDNGSNVYIAIGSPQNDTLPAGLELPVITISGEQTAKGEGEQTT